MCGMDIMPYVYMCAAAAAKSLQSCPTLCDPRDDSPPGSPVPGILQARTLEWVAISFSNAWKWKVKVKVKSCPTLSDPMDCSLPGSSVHGIFQARVLEWGAIAFSNIPISNMQIWCCLMLLLGIRIVFCFFHYFQLWAASISRCNSLLKIGLVKLIYCSGYLNVP